MSARKTAKNSSTPKNPTSQKQIDANRRNALKSSGPKSPAGRAIASQNARKHHLLPFEDAPSVGRLIAEYYGRFIPTTPEERQLVDVLAYAERVRRYCSALEAHIQVGDIAEVVDSNNQTLAEALDSVSRRLALVPTHRQSADCAQSNALSQLEAMRKQAA